ncbi:hypothetical protein ZWY2020_009481 [Hordeum vulgare]|nr:hypothetical protein ZWY2020_009481 [Hordeum vulgare]
MYLLFDPTMSLHYHVLFFPNVPDKPKPPCFQPAAGVSQFMRADYEHDLGAMEWPPYMYPLQVFSSETGRWEEKQFIRQGDAAVTVSDVRSDGSSPVSSQDGLRRHAVYWRGSFYVYCDTGFIMRLSLDDERNYLVVKTPRVDITAGCKRHLKTYDYLGKSKHGVYFTAFHGYLLQVWVLRDTVESCPTPEWELKHHVDLEPNLKLHYNRHFRREKYEKCWILDSCDEESEGDEESEDSEDYAWDSSDDSVVDDEGGINMDYKDYYFAIDLLGYHPYKEIAFLGNRFQGFAYYLDNSKLQYLGSPYPSYLNKHDCRLLPMLESFIYTPCMDDLLPVQNDA